MKIDRATADKIIAANLSNVVKKVKAGKPLTRAELDLVKDSEEIETPAAPIDGKAAKVKPAKKLGVAANMTAAAARTGLAPEAVKEAKARGCTAFHQSGRIDCDALLEYAIANPQFLETDDGKPNKALEDALLTRTNRQIREQKLLDIRRKNITRAEMGTRLRALALEQKAILEKELKGHPKIVAKLCGLMRELVSTWTE